MTKQWNPVEEHIEGVLCEKGFMSETFDFEQDELVRKLTDKGRERALELLKFPEWRREYVKMAQRGLKNAPLELRKIVWKKIANQLRNS